MSFLPSPFRMAVAFGAMLAYALVWGSWIGRT